MFNSREGISIAQFFDMMEICGTTEAVLLEGDTGIGKTEITKQFADSKNLPLCTIQVSESTDMTDVFGLPDFSTDGHTIYKPPSWYLGPNVKCVVFMDEVNRNKVVMKGLMRLATDHRIGDITIPDGSYVIAAINPEYGQLYQVVEMDPAHRARFHLIQLKPTSDEWLAFAAKAGVHESIIRYITDHSEDLDTFHNTSNVSAAGGQYYHNVLPCRRQFMELSRKLYNGENFRGTGVSRFDMEKYSDGEDMLYATVAGLVGVGVADRFVSYYYSNCNGMAAKLLYGSEKDWAKGSDMVKDLIKMSKQDIPSLTALGNSLMDLVARQENDMWNDTHDGPSDKARAYGTNVFKFLYLCPAEVVTSIYYTKVKPALDECTKQKKLGDDSRAPKWEKLMCIAVPKIKELFDKYVK